jgi:hypothetical protein
VASEKDMAPKQYFLVIDLSKKIGEAKMKNRIAPVSVSEPAADIIFCMLTAKGQRLSLPPTSFKSGARFHIYLSIWPTTIHHVSAAGSCGHQVIRSHPYFPCSASWSLCIHMSALVFGSSLASAAESKAKRHSGSHFVADGVR